MSIQSEAIISVNGKVMGNLDDLVKQPTEEFKEAMQGLVERAMPPSEPVSQELTSKSDFDYRRIEEQYRDEVKAAAQSIHQHGRSIVSEIVTIGKRLIEVKDMIPHGEFTDWIAGEFQMDERAAQRMMNVARQYGDIQNRQTLSVFSPSVLYLLAAPSTPEEARAEVEQAAAAGQKITVEFARETIQKRKPAPVDSAPIWQLELEIRSWLNEKIGEGGTPDIDAVLDSIKSQTNDPVKSGSWLDLLDKAVTANGVEFRKSDMTQAINNVRDQRKQARRQANSKVVYLGSEVDQSVMKLLTLDMRSDAFKAALLTATEDQLVEALKRVPPASDKDRYLKIGNRRELLALAQDAAHVDELIEATMPSQATPLEQAIAEAIPVAEPDKPSRRVIADYDVPPDLKRYGYYLQDFGSTWGWSSRMGGGSGPNTSRDQAIENARHALAHENWVGRALDSPETTADVRHKSILLGITNGVVSDINFDTALQNATAAQLADALDRIPADGNKTKREKIDTRLRGLAKEGDGRIEIDDAMSAAGHFLVRQGSGYCVVSQNGGAFTFTHTDSREGAIAFARDWTGIEAPTPALSKVETKREVDEVVATPAADPVMPDDLADAGFTFVRVGKGMWAVEIDNLREPYVSNWCFDPMDAVEDARAYLATLAPSTPPAPSVMPDDLTAAGYTLIDTKPGPGWCWHKGSGKSYASGPSLEHNNGVAISPEAAIADARRHYERSGGKLPKVAPKATIADDQAMSLGECLSIFELAKTATRRAVELQPSLRNAALDMQPSLRRLIEATRKVTHDA